jgi:hypothetical protein
MFKNIIVVIIVLGSLALFEPAFLDRQTIGLIHLSITGLIFTLLILYSVYDTSRKIRPSFTLEIILLFFAVCLSMIGAFVFHFQQFQITLMAQRVIYLFIFYFLLHQLKPEPRFVIRLFMVISLIWSVLYMIQWIAFPTHLFGSQMFKDRNTIRIFLPGVTYAVISYFVCLLKFLKTSHYKYLFPLLILLLVFVLLGTRQLLGPILLITILAVVQSKKIHSKAFLTFLGIASIVPIYFIFQDIINAMIDITLQQGGKFAENVRFKAVMFYLYRFAPGKLSFLIGNGAYSGHSAYGIMMDNYSKLFGYYLSDIGIIGEFILYGIIFVTAELIILFKIAFIQYHEEFHFIKYVVYSMFFSIFVGGGAFGTAEGIVMMCLLLYLVDVSKWIKKDVPDNPVRQQYFIE